MYRPAPLSIPNALHQHEAGVVRPDLVRSVRVGDRRVQRLRARMSAGRSGWVVPCSGAHGGRAALHQQKGPLARPVLERLAAALHVARVWRRGAPLPLRAGLGEAVAGDHIAVVVRRAIVAGWIRVADDVECARLRVDPEVRVLPHGAVRPLVRRAGDDRRVAGIHDVADRCPRPVHRGRAVHDELRLVVADDVDAAVGVPRRRRIVAAVDSVLRCSPWSVSPMARVHRRPDGLLGPDLVRQRGVSVAGLVLALDARGANPSAYSQHKFRRVATLLAAVFDRCATGLLSCGAAFWIPGGKTSNNRQDIAGCKECGLLFYG